MKDDLKASIEQTSKGGRDHKQGGLMGRNTITKLFRNMVRPHLRNFKRICKSRMKNVFRLQLDVLTIFFSIWFVTIYFAFKFGNDHSNKLHKNFMKRNTCFNNSGGEQPFSEHNGDYDIFARAQMVYEVDKWLYRNTSEIGQDIEVFNNRFLGNVLVVEDEIMITENDERNYHEMISHTPLAYLSDVPNVRVLLIGGGDGGTLFQVLKHSNVEQVTMVELDEDVVKVSKTFFPEFAKSYDDPRVKLIFGDGAKFVSERLNMTYVEVAEAEKEEILIADKKGITKAKFENEFELVIVDSTDYGPAIPLFSRQFYMQIQELLNDEKGILVFNCESPAWALHTVSHVSSLISSVFRRNYVYQVFQPTYVSGHYTFVFASDNIHPLNSFIDWGKYDIEKLQTRYYNKAVHLGSFYLPEFLKDVVTYDDI